MRIMVIGHPGAGKTALIAQGYAGLRRAGGLGLRAAAADHLRLGWAARRLAAGRPLPPTARPHAYRFRLRPPGGRAAQFSVHDHPGGAVTGTGATALLVDLPRADAIIAVVAREDLARGGRHAANRARPLAVLVRRRLLAPRGSPFPLVLAVRGGGGPEPGEDALLEPFRALQATASLGGLAMAVVWLRDRPAVPEGGSGTSRPADCLLWCLRFAVPLPPEARPVITGPQRPKGHDTDTAQGKEAGLWTGFSPSP